MRDYGRVYTQFWTSPDIQPMSDKVKLLGLYLLTSAHSNLIGCFRLPFEYVAADLRWSRETIRKRFDELSSKGFAHYDDTHSWVFIPRYLRFNPIENPNQGKAARKLIEQVPRNSSLFQPLITTMLEHPQPFVNGLETLIQPLQDASGTSSSSSSRSRSRKLEDTAPTSVAPPLPPVITFPLNDGSERPISAVEVDEWCRLFPAVDVVQELRGMRAWLLANPKRRKTTSGVPRFATTWLSKEQNRGGSRPVTDPNNGNGHHKPNLPAVDLTLPPPDPGAQEVLRQADEQEAQARGRS